MKRGSCRSACEFTQNSADRFIVNDTYRTDLSLLYPPYLIALAALYTGHCLTSINSNPTTQPRTRSSTQQVHPSTHTALGVPPIPSGDFAAFLASFQVSLPVLMACVQDIIVLYPIWEGFEPAPRPNPGRAKAETFGPIEAEALVRRMIEQRAEDDNKQVVGKKRKL